MGIGTIKIDKLSEKNKTGYYKVSTDDYESIDFYMEINKINREVKFYFSKDFSEPIHIINCNKRNMPIGSIPGVPMKVFSGVFIKVMKILDLDIFPDRLSYSA